VGWKAIVRLLYSQAMIGQLQWARLPTNPSAVQDVGQPRIDKPAGVIQDSRMTDPQRIEHHLATRFGFDQYQAWHHATENRTEISNSIRCACFFCFADFAPDAIIRWMDGGQTACCPACGTGNTVIGSASGLPMNQEFLELVHAHWFQAAP